MAKLPAQSLSALDCGARIKFARKSKGLTIGGAATALKKDRNAYKRLELGKSLPSALSLRGICILFDVTADYLLGIGEPMHEKPPTRNLTYVSTDAPSLLLPDASSVP